MRLCALLYFFVTINALVVGNEKYLVLLKKSETLERFLSYDHTFPFSQRFKRLINKYYKIGELIGFSGTFSRKSLERLKLCPLVGIITEDVDFQAFDLEEQDGAPVHLVKLSQERGSHEKRTSYYYDSTAQGEGVYVYIIDTGVQADNREFEGRAWIGKDFIDERGDDMNGHGTHVAGIVGSRTFGVSKRANLVAVKSLDKAGHGSLSNILAAIEFAVNDRRERGVPGVINLSLGAPANELLNSVLDYAWETGMAVVVAAGNQNSNACDTLPASSQKAITVGATDDYTSGIAEFLNWGPCVDIFTVGVDVPSVTVSSWRRFQRLSGTSMAAPIISGLVANLLSLGIPAHEVKQELLRMATAGVISRRSLDERPGSPNLLAYNGCDPLADLGDVSDDED